MRKILALCGISGTGKTTLREKLIRDKDFYTMVQVTTRQQREGESDESYIFLTNHQYDYMKSMLIGKTQFLGNRYGTLLPQNDMDKIGIIILNEEGLKDFNREFKERTDVQTLSIGLDKDISTLEVTREGRGIKELMREKRVIKLCDEVITLGDGEYASVEDIKEILKRNKML